MSSENAVYETVGTIDRAAANHVEMGGETILVDDGDDELRIAQPKAGNGGDRDE